VLAASGSVVDRLPTTASAPAFSSRVPLSRASAVGVSLTFVMVIILQ